MDPKRLDTIKRLVIIALFSDDELMNKLVLKGGNAIDLIHGAAMRGSIDLDFSVDTVLPMEKTEDFRQRLERLLDTALGSEGFAVLDVDFRPRPPIVSPDLESFWGGYALSFKIIEQKKLPEIRSDMRKLRTSAETIAPGHKKTFHVDISRHEYTEPKEERELDGYTIYVYTPEMIVCEKLRAICQQMPAYARIVRSTSQSARAKDFFDIYTLVTHYRMDLTSPANRELLARVFQAKRVPLTLLGEIGQYRSFHRGGFASVVDTVKPGVDLKNFDYYFDFVVDEVARLEPFGDK